MIGGLFYIGDAMPGDSRHDPFATSKLDAFNAGRNSTGKYLSVDWNSNDLLMVLLLAIYPEKKGLLHVIFQLI